MKIVTSKGEYDLPVGFVLEIERSNPFWSEVSEKSIPVTLPGSPNNLAIIGVDPISLSGKPTTKLDVTIVDGSISLQATQVIHSISDEGISTTFYFYLSRFWDEINNLKLRKVLSIYSLLTSSIRRGEEEVYIDNDSSYAIFPVVVEIPGIAEKFVLNSYSMTNSDYPALDGWNNRTIGDSERVEVPAGYGITIFLKSEWLLKRVFALFGYKLNDSLLTGVLRNIVWLNTVADAAVKANIQYSHLVPDITVQDFLEVYRTSFDCEFVVNDATRVVDVVFYKNIGDQSKLDISEYALKKRAVNFKDKFSQLKITNQRNIAGTECEIPTLERLLAKYINIGAFTEADWSNKDYRKKYSCIYRLAEGRFYLVSKGVVKESISSAYFDYDKENDLEYHEVALKQSVVPMIEHDSNIVPFLGTAIHFNTHIKDADEAENNSKYNPMWCFVKFASEGVKKIAYGSINNYNRSGIRDGDYSLQVWGDDGLFKRFHSKRDAILRHSHIPLSIDMLIPEYLKISLLEYQPVVVDNQLLEIDKISYTLGQTGVKTCNFKSLRLYEPCDLLTEQSVPELTTDHGNLVAYCWILESDISEVVDNYGGGGATDYGSKRIDPAPTEPSVSPTEEDYQAALGGKKVNEKRCAIEIREYEWGNYLQTHDDYANYWYTAKVV